jgi:hypothetical protein
MVNKTEEKKDMNEENKDIFKTWKDSYTTVSKIWGDSYLKLHKPWMEFTGEMLEKTALLSKEAAPQKYREFYEDWIKTCQNTFGKLYPISTLKSNKECYDMWMKSYEKIFDELLELPAQKSTKEIFGNYMGIPDIYLGSILHMSELWKKSYAQLCEPLNDSMLKLSEKIGEISRGDAGPEAYKEFYTLWMNTNKEIYGKYIKSMEPSGEMFEHFVKSSYIYLSMYKSSIAALETMSEKAEEMSKQTFDPMKEIMGSVKVMAKMYADTFTKMSKTLLKSGVRSASAYPGKITT